MDRLEEIKRYDLEHDCGSDNEGGWTECLRPSPDGDWVAYADVKAQLEAAQLRAQYCPSERCRRTGEQWCHVCDDATCGDNTSPLRKALEAAQSSLKELHDKDRGRTNEHNILVEENRQLKADFEAAQAVVCCAVYCKDRMTIADAKEPTNV